MHILVRVFKIYDKDKKNNCPDYATGAWIKLNCYNEGEFLFIIPWNIWDMSQLSSFKNKVT